MPGAVSNPPDHRQRCGARWRRIVKMPTGPCCV